jgi:hypothetical protein
MRMGKLDVFYNMMMLFMEHAMKRAVNMKLILYIFDQLSGLKINFHKSELFYLGKAKDMEQQYMKIMGCKSGVLPMRYPVHYRILRNTEWNHVESWFISKLGSWPSNLLSYGDRLVLINYVLTSMPIFMLLFLEIPKGARKRLNLFRSNFF